MDKKIRHSGRSSEKAMTAVLLSPYTVLFTVFIVVPVLCAVFLGPWYGVVNAFCISLPVFGILITMGSRAAARRLSHERRRPLCPAKTTM